MPKQEYPKYLFHADNARAQDPTPPRLVRTVEEHQALLAEGWAESPEEAQGQPRAHPPVDPNIPWAGDLPGKRAPAAAKVEYPKYLFKHKDPDSPRLVRSEAEHVALGPAWCESPDEAKAVYDGPPASADPPPPPAEVPPPPVPDAVNGTTSNVTPEILSVPPVPPPPQSALTVTGMNLTEAALYIETITDLEQLTAVYQEEEAGKKRAGVKTLIDKRLNELAASPADGK